MAAKTDHIRTRETVEDGIKAREDNGATTFVEYQPGNGTRYALVFTRLNEMPATRRALGAGEDAVLVTLATDPKGSRACVFTVGGYIEPYRVEERLTPRRFADAAALCEVIAHVVGGTCPSLEEMAGLL